MEGARKNISWWGLKEGFPEFQFMNCLEIQPVTNLKHFQCTAGHGEHSKLYYVYMSYKTHS